ncbi:MAG: hypothetical protein GXO27_03215 [Chlorobi bacterium]|nr:hypothetical protein [Chlorobiota bacterium]
MFTQNDYLPGEYVIRESDGKKLVLTNYRIRYDDEDFTSIMLEKVSSVKVSSIYHFKYIIWGVLFLLSGPFLSDFLFGDLREVFLYFSIGLGIFFIILFFLTRKHLFIIRSDGGDAIEMPIRYLSQKEIQAIVNDIEQAKVERVANMHRLPVE